MKKENKSVLNFKKSKVSSLESLKTIKGGDELQAPFTTHDPQAGMPRCILTSKVIVTKII
jgi:hypothetical protein